jgi:hypothetical protein
MLHFSAYRCGPSLVLPKGKSEGRRDGALGHYARRNGNFAHFSPMQGERGHGYKINGGNMNSISHPASITPPASDSSAALLTPPAASGIPAGESRSHRHRSSFSVAVRAFVSGLVDDSAFHDVSLGREMSVIFNGPLIYRPKKVPSAHAQ